jgi:Ca-activated chloride channel homolog
MSALPVLASLELGTPKWMPVLYVLVVAVGVYAYGNRWRRKAAVEFSGAEMLSRLARKPRKLRLVAPTLVILAAFVVALAAASPAWVASSTSRIVLVVDVSNSMTATDVSPDRQQAVTAAVEQFVADVPADVDVGLVAYDRSVRKVLPPGVDPSELVAELGALESGGGSSTGDAIQRATELLGSGGVLIVISDGAASDGPSPIQAAGDALRRKVRVNTLAVGTPSGSAVVDGEVLEVPVENAELVGVAAAGGGTNYGAISSDQVYAAMGTIAANTEPVQDRTEFAGPMAGVAAALLALALLVASRWTLRLP